MEPDIGCVPFQAPPATQEIALDEVHVSTDELPAVTDVGAADKATVGAGAETGAEPKKLATSTYRSREQDILPDFPLVLVWSLLKVIDTE